MKPTTGRGTRVSRIRSHIAVLAVLTFCSLVLPPGLAQEFRGSITGQVVDGSGGAVVGAQVTVVNVGTNVATTAASNEGGSYTVLYLVPGTYTVTVEANGFKKLIRQGIEVRVADKLKLDLTLEVGAVQESLNVTAGAPLLEAATASTGQLIDARRIADLPLSDRNPFTLARLAPGIAYTGDLKFSRPFDNAGTSSVVADGAPGRNEFTLDGSPNMASGGGLGRVAFVPPADAVQEFKVVTASYDAQQGHTAGANINVTLKSGTNRLRGSLYEYNRNDFFSANDFFLNRAGQPRGAVRYNLYGGTVGGPVRIPKLYNGRDKTFFFFAYEGIRDTFPEPLQFTVPTDAQRSGDLSSLLAQGIVIYDPLTAVREGSRIRRTAFPNNRIPADRISSISKAYMDFYPRPNQPADSQGRNNFISGNPRSDTFNSETVRVDHTLTDKQQFFARYTRNWRRELRNAWTSEINGIIPTGNYLFRINNAGAYDHIYTMSPSTILNFRIGFARFNEPNVRPHEDVFDPATLGFSGQTVSFFGGAKHLPRFRISSDDGPFSPLGDGIGGGTTHNIYSAQPTLTTIHGSHNFKIGYDFRSYRENSFGPGNAAGRYEFGTNFTRGPLDNSAAAPIGQEFAAFLLGQPTGGVMDRNASRANQTLYHGIFFHDDWKLNRKLTLNLGIRYELEAAPTERFNRNVRGFDSTSSSPIEAAAKAAYAANPIPEVSPADFKVRGGLLFVAPAHRGFWSSDKNNWQPRIGFAYQVNDRTVVRGGFGMYAVPFVIDGVQQPGFSQATNIVPTLDNGLTFVANLFSPFPSGVADPPGATLGLATFIGRDIEFFPVDLQSGLSKRWSVGIQRQLPGQWLVEAAYVGNAGSDLTTTTDIMNAIPRQYLSTLNVRDDAVINFLTANVKNPFQNLAPGTNLNGSTVQRQQLLRAFPHFTRVRTRRDDGSSNYQSAQFRAERRFVHGYTLNVSYTWSKLLEQTSFLNESDTVYEKRLSDSDIRHRFVVSGIFELPFGRGRKLGNDWHPALDAVVGGWTFSAIYQAQTGRPLTLGNVAFFGDLRTLNADIKGETANRVFDTSGFYFTDAPVQTNGVVDPAKQRADRRIQLANNIRTLPSRLPWFLGQGLNLWDISAVKNFRITETVRIQLHTDFLNATNHPEFNNPELNPTNSNFGKVTSQNNLPRNLQIGLRLTF
ncbi:MAG TPA: carboxypeptidase-like regulatory domain-containing protein [Blastocatellia bacterium]|nr:carboxypeptidase-like regulatory domain-containing protein [Blastocatellia bacterium]